MTTRDRTGNEAQVAALESSLESFAACVCTLDSLDYLGSIGRWTPRDIVAHLIGWNRAVIVGSDQLRVGELPFYDVDPGPDYSKVNAAFLREYPTTDREQLLSELEESAKELGNYLQGLDPDDWERDFGVRHGAERLTIRGAADELIADYEHHRRQIQRAFGGSA
ncbi:MAG: DinB family protein [Gemmatimonadales bacterium]|jgi:hypothetical protein